ncbi:MAG: hypothetical protein KC431_07355, partial [Myxococcales bacterium]|nr:hypothetical protein [Myxococcales bacterium]
DTTTDTTVGTTTDGGECVDGDEQCKVDGHQICEGGVWVDAPCPDGTFCNEATDSCDPCVCNPGETADCSDPDNIETCKEDCSGFEPVPCGNGVCVDGACVDLVCAPGQVACVDLNNYHECNGDGTMWGPDTPCGPGEDCFGGVCVSACEQAAAVKSNVGCEFWAVDMENLPPRDKYTYAVTVSNPSFDEDVTVRIFDRNGGNEQQLIMDTIAPREAKVFNLSGSHAGFTSYYNGQDAGFIGTGIRQGRAFRIETSLPVLATQFNPIGGATGYTTDASLLLPTHSLGLNYIHLGWNAGYGSGSAMNIVATEDATTVTITPKFNIAASNGLPALPANVATPVMLNKYDYIQVGAGNNQLTGTGIETDKPVAVFGGHTCGNVPNTGTTACDHIEEQIFPLETWGVNYVAGRNPPRGNEQMTWRIVASEDNTTVNFNPPVSIGASTVLNAGQMVQFNDPGDFFVSADDPILVAGYMQGCTATGVPSCPGDPYMVLMVPVEQYLDDYVFVVDTSYVEDFAKLVRPAGAEVTVDCLGIVPENRWTAIGASGYDFAVIDMNPGEASCTTGTNQASSPEGFGLTVSGQSYAASYAYPGGLALQEINPQ